MKGDSLSHSIHFFETQFRQQVADGALHLNPFETLALPFLRGRVLDYGCGLGNLAVAAAQADLREHVVEDEFDAVVAIGLLMFFERTTATQRQHARQQLDGLKRFLGARLAGTVPLPAAAPLKLGAGGAARTTLGGETFVLRHTDAHYPGDALVHLPKQNLVFAGDLVYVDRLLGVLPWSSVKNGQRAFRALAELQPAHIVPGHGRVCDLAQAQRETGDYYDFLADTIGKAAREMEPMDEVLGRNADLPAFRHLENYQDLHCANMNRAFTEFEGL